MIGRSIGRFRILAPLGQGGMASVWRARDELLGRELALKLLSEPLAQSEQSRRRFRREALIAAALDHPGIAAVYDSGESDGATWIAMALIDGETLAERVARSLVPVPQVLSIAIAVADALGYAHERGVVHRDVTSRNVMLGRDGRVFVLDFGLALAQGVSRISSSGTMVGTAPYMAPELLLGETATHSTDLYSLGVVMYEALTGSLPFAGDRPAAMTFARLHQAPRPPSELRPEIPGALDAAVLRCLSRDPAVRFSGAADLAGTLRSLADSPAPATVESAAMPRSVVAVRLADRSGPAYVAVPPFEHAEDAGATATASLARELAAALAAGLGQLERLHVVPAPAAPRDRSAEGLRGYARDLGVNLLVLGGVRQSGTRLRVTFTVHDPEAGLHVAGDALEGSTLDPFELEDRVLASLRHALAHDAGDAGTGRAPGHDPAAPERYQQALRYMERFDDEASVDAAIATLRRLIETEGESAATQAALARALLSKYELTKQRSWEAQAAAAGARAAELAPDAYETLLALGDLHRFSGHLEEAERDYGRALAQRPGAPEAQLGRARTLHALGREEEAEAACLLAIRESPDDWRGFVFLGRMRFDRGNYRGTLEPWQEVVRLVPSSALGARNLGSAMFHLDRFDEAIAEYRRSLQLQPNARAYTNLGTVLFFLKRYPEAREAFEKSVALSPSDPTLWGNLGNACRFIPEAGPEARAALERAVGLMRERLERNPEDHDGWGRLAGWLVNLGHRPEAEQAIVEALRRGPADVHCMARALHVYWQLGQRDRALQYTRAALEHGYGARSLLESPDLAELRRDPAFQELISQYPGSSGGRLPGPDGQKENS